MFVSVLRGMERYATAVVVPMHRDYNCTEYSKADENDTPSPSNSLAPRVKFGMDGV